MRGPQKAAAPAPVAPQAAPGADSSEARGSAVRAAAAGGRGSCRRNTAGAVGFMRGQGAHGHSRIETKGGEDFRETFDHRPCRRRAGCAGARFGALAQRQPPTPEQRHRPARAAGQRGAAAGLPKGRPADTAGFADDPAATQSSVMSLDQRLDALERQMADMLRQTEENGNRLRSLEAGIGQLKADQEQRIQALEQRMSEAVAAVPATADAAPAPAPRRTPAQAEAAIRPRRNPPKASQARLRRLDAAVDRGPPPRRTRRGCLHARASTYGKPAITTRRSRALRAFVAAYPKHRRASYANNLIGRALLDKGEPRAAAKVLLANYRNNPGGERAPDSLYYLGQALMKLGQPAQACKAYGELDAVYGAKIRPDLKKLENDAKAAGELASRSCHPVAISPC